MDCNNYEQHDCCECGCEEEIRCICKTQKKHKKKANRTSLKCGTQGSVTLPATTVAGATFNVASINVDTRGFERPCIKLEFASNIVTTAALLTLNFQVSKLCKNQLVPLPVGPVWTFSRLAAATDGNTFTFFVCECDVCDEDCCNYIVTATVAGLATAGITTINNATLSAIIVDDSCGC